MSNRLKQATSPYLLQHADNPVDWYEWGPEAFEKAAKEDKPIFLSIGYSACHWCHVMAHESFEDSESAAQMNENFVNIKLDREERPDIDALYMDAVVAMTGQGGWPMSVFLTTDGKPFYGGTYFPAQRRHNLPSFREVLASIAHAWKEEPDRLGEIGSQIADRVAASLPLPSDAGVLDTSSLERSAERLFQTYDWAHGGWGNAPKFPQASSIEFLFRAHHRYGDPLARDMATHALDRMAAGGIYDQIGGGFHRYSVDAQWLVPHFEKMLYDNALLARTYLIGWLVTGKEAYRRVVEQTLDFVLRELGHPEGGIFSSLDADTEGEEGRFYVWTIAEMQEAVRDQALSDLVLQAYGATEEGNFEGRNILYRATEPGALSEQFGRPAESVERELQEARDRLFAERDRRVRPGLDDKVITAWNGLALVALAEAGRALEREDYCAAAQRLGAFLLENLYADGVLMRSWRVGRARFSAYLEDHAALGEGMLSLYQTDFNPRWFEAARIQADEILGHFQDPQGGFFDTRDDHEQLIARPKSLQDTPIPSGNSLAASLLLKLGALTGESVYREPAEAVLRAMQANSVRHPTAFAAWLCGLDFALGPQLQLALMGDPDQPEFKALLDVERSQYLPRVVVAGGPIGTKGAPALLDGRGLVDGKPTAYLCEGFVCQLPTTSPETLREQVTQGL